MILALSIEVPLLLFTLWLFVKFSPSGVERKRLYLFNTLVFVVAVILCGALTLKIYSVMADSLDEAWWPMLSVLGSLVVLPLCLAIGGLIRNYLVFRPHSLRSP